MPVALAQHLLCSASLTNLWMFSIARISVPSVKRAGGFVLASLRVASVQVTASPWAIDGRACVPLSSSSSFSPSRRPGVQRHASRCA